VGAFEFYGDLSLFGKRNEILISAHMLIFEDFHPKLIKLIRELRTIITPCEQ